MAKKPVSSETAAKPGRQRKVAAGASAKSRPAKRSSPKKKAASRKPASKGAANVPPHSKGGDSSRDDAKQHKPFASDKSADSAMTGWTQMMTAMARHVQKQMMTNAMAEPFAAMPTMGMSEPGGGMGAVAFDSQALGKLQAEYAGRLSSLLGQQPDKVKPEDKRFGSHEWQNGLFGWNAAMYELNAEFMDRMGSALTGESRDVQRVRFAISQWVDAMSPANYLITNPQAQQAMLDSQGGSLQAGMQNLLQDLAKGRISQTDEEAFSVGENLAVTPGSVVFENDLIQLIQYQPSTPKVGTVPHADGGRLASTSSIFLTCQPSNSVVAWLVGQGHTVFMVSWKNVQADQGSLTWDDYLEQGAITAINVVQEISGQPQINALGFCVGGTIVATAVAGYGGPGMSTRSLL